MADVPPTDDTADLLKNISLDSQNKCSESPEPVKKASVAPGNDKIQPSNRTLTPLIPDFMDPTVAYYPDSFRSTGYYYGGYDGSTNDWDVYSMYMNPDGVDLAYGVYGYGYAPYGTYSSASSPVSTVSHGGQLSGAQHYQYPTPYFQPPTPTGGPFPASASPTKDETTIPAVADKPPLAADTTKGSIDVCSKGNTGSIPIKPAPIQNSVFNVNGSYEVVGQSGYPDLRCGYNGIYAPISWLDGPMSFEPQTRNKDGASRTQSYLKGPNSVSGSTGYSSGMYANKLYGQYGTTYRSGYCYGTNGYGLQNNGCGWLAVDNKFRSRVRGNGVFGYNNENSDGLNELNRGPRARTIKNQKPSIPTDIAIKGDNTTLSPTDSIMEESKEVNLTPDREQYNKTEFPERYADAKFFIIKSYSEDDVHKSIKYNVWASTQNGNKKLNAAYHEAQQKSEGCPVFLFFSVNTSGQFVGVAEMVGPVDFNRSLEYWQQDKWIGCFPVKWHIVKDIPNSLLKDIILEYNENKPVTNSRDTQEVKLEQGLQMIKIFKEHSSKQCILDDFEFYEDRQKKIQQKKAKQQQFQKRSLEGKTVPDIKDGIEKVLKSDNRTSSLVDEVKHVDVGQAGVAKPAEMNVVVNDVANAC